MAHNLLTGCAHFKRDLSTLSEGQIGLWGWLFVLILGLLMTFAPVLAVEGTRVVEGLIYDADTSEPIPYATVRVPGSDRSTLANEEGRYRVLLVPGESQLRFSHIAYFSELVDLTPGDSVLAYDVGMHTCMVDVGSMKVYGREYDPGQRIIVEAIRRKEDILSKIDDYCYDAYVKLLVNDETKPDSSEIWLLVESQVTAFWEQPDRYKEIIKSRRQSANIQAENNLVTVGEIVNFNRNRIEIGQYSLVSPTAEDALDHYNYYLMDTLYQDSLAIFRLEIEPKNPQDPLFEGFIHIADSTFDVVMVDVGFSPGVDLSLLINPRYSQRFAKFENEYWMPIEVRFGGRVEFKTPIPFIPDKLSFSHIASLYSYEFDAGHPKGTFGEYLIEVEKDADEFDSTSWFANQTIPLTSDEMVAYERIDSIENEPKSIGKKLLTGLAIAPMLLVFGPDDFVRFNRVEGYYLGVGLSHVSLSDQLTGRLNTGYAFGAKRAEYQVGLTWQLHQGRRLALGFDYRRRIEKQPTLVSNSDYNPTLLALAAGYDPFDYYRAEGWGTFVSTKLVDHTRLRLQYNDYRHESAPVVTQHTILEGDADRPRWNSPIVEGDFRSLEATFRYDSRKMFRNKGRDVRIDEVEYLTFEAGIEAASPDWIDNDFDFRRYHVELQRRQRSLGLGVTSFRIYAGGSEGDLPPQRYYTVDFGGFMNFNGIGPATITEKNFSGNQALLIYAQHDFRRRIFVASGIPLVKDIPLWLSVHGGVFWTEFNNHQYQIDDDLINTAERPYRELGFGLGNLTPFLMPFNFALTFTWQISHYDTSRFQLGLGLEL